MPCKSRIEQCDVASAKTYATGALHHIIIREIERKALGKYRWCGHSVLMGKTKLKI